MCVLHVTSPSDISLNPGEKTFSSKKSDNVEKWCLILDETVRLGTWQYFSHITVVVFLAKILKPGNDEIHLFTFLSVMSSLDVIKSMVTSPPESKSLVSRCYLVFPSGSYIRKYILVWKIGFFVTGVCLQSHCP